MIDFWKKFDFEKKIYEESYIQNGIRVMKKYLLPSLENQSCKKFIWILMLGHGANLTYIKSLINFKTSFEKKVIYKNSIKRYVKNVSKGYDILITSRIDYDDRIYYDAVNDVRKIININKPMLIYGYNRGLIYYEEDDKYYYFWWNAYNNQGPMSIFISLCIVLKSVNDTYIIHDLGDHPFLKTKILSSYKSFGIKKLNYVPYIFDSGEPKFVWVRQNYSGTYHKKFSNRTKSRRCIFNLSKFFGK